MATLYYNNAAMDGDLGNIVNWWQDASCTIQADALPGSGDTGIVNADVTNGSVATAVLIVNSANFSAAADATSSIVFNGGTFSGTFFCPSVTFDNTGIAFAGRVYG